MKHTLIQNHIKIIFNALFFIFLNISDAQVMPEWISVFNSPTNDYEGAWAITTDKMGNVYVGGSTYKFGEGKNGVVIKYNSSGVQQWYVFYNGPTSNDDDAGRR